MSEDELVEVIAGAVIRATNRRKEMSDQPQESAIPGWNVDGTRRNQPQDCNLDTFFSGICIRGTKGCNVIHPEANTKGSDQPQEWTGERILADFQKVNGIDIHALADAINAELAAERERVTMIMATDCKMKLDAEREKVKVLANALNEVDGPYAADDALTALKK